MGLTKRTFHCVALGFAVAVMGQPPAMLARTGLIAGVELGVANPDGKLNHREDPGGSISPFLGYMFNDYLGLAGSAQYAGFPYKNRIGIDDNSLHVVSGLAGPRLAVPLGALELYGMWQGGAFTGLQTNSPVTRTSWGFSTGGGINFPASERFLMGAFAKYNWLDQHIDHNVPVHRDVDYFTAGVALTFNPPPAPEPPPAVAIAPPEPEVEPAPEPAAVPPPAKKKLVLRGVNFDFDKADIRRDARPILDEAVATLGQERAIAVVAEGHTDSSGSDQYNEKLSLRRAAAVRDYLISGGIESRRISVQGFGESQPVAGNETEDGRAQNRRVELRIAQ
jgi:outer membrane protein OmpA-like peptidoglycan-associated protein